MLREASLRATRCLTVPPCWRVGAYEKTQGERDRSTKTHFTFLKEKVRITRMNLKKDDGSMKRL
jgi:hypothetical protein